MKKTNLLFLTILGALIASTIAVPYGVPRTIDSLKIPYCLDQTGFRCRVCGYNTDTKVPTAPNKLGTACLPSAAGCTQYADMTGTICDKNAQCYCGFNRDVNGNCVKKVIDNCYQLDFSGTTCQTCINPSTAKYGGGISDYGQSFDGKKCIDNAANGTPFCWKYSSGDLICAKCQANYYLNSLNKCIKSPLGTIGGC